MEHNIHRYYPNSDCTEYKQVKEDDKAYTFNTNGYNIYKCVWNPDKIEYYINDILKYEVVNQEYDWWPEHKLGVVLSQQVMRTEVHAPPYDFLNPITPQTSCFDWVKVREFFLAPEITCPNIICTNGTAIMDVAPDAANITWSLSPTNLFSGSTS